MGRLGWHGGILSTTDNYSFQLVKATGAPYYSINAANTKKWQHLVAVYNNYVMKLYSNGVKIPTEITIESLVGYNDNFYIGGEYSGTYDYAGLLDGVRVYDAPISAFQIKEQYYTGLNKMLANGNIEQEEYKQRIEEISLNK